MGIVGALQGFFMSLIPALVTMINQSLIRNSDCQARPLAILPNTMYKFKIFYSAGGTLNM